MLAGDVKGAQKCMARHLDHVRSLWARGESAEESGGRRSRPAKRATTG